MDTGFHFHPLAIVSWNGHGTVTCELMVGVVQYVFQQCRFPARSGRWCLLYSEVVTVCSRRIRKAHARDDAEFLTASVRAFADKAD